MRTVNEVSKLTGVSIRTLHYYDKIGLLKPSEITEAGYRMYDDGALERLRHIMFYRELQFPLKEIKEIVDSPDFERNRALEQQIELLTLKKEHIEHLILFARGILGVGVKYMDFSAFDTSKLDDYAVQAKAMWGKTDAYKEYERKTANISEEEKKHWGEDMMQIFAKFGEIKDNMSPDSEKAQALARELQDYITKHFYTCTKEILAGLGKMYGGGGKITENIDEYGGAGTAKYAAEAIEAYCME